MLPHATLLSIWIGLASATVICPDGLECPEKNTCCLTEGGYGCCIYPSAVCCSDQVHCCPAGYHCSEAVQSCVKDSLPWLRLPWHKNMPAKEPEMTLFKHLTPDFETNASQEKPSDVSVVWCDSYYQCQDGATCCRYVYGSWFCCVFTSGHCCRDGIHCCPAGTYCDATSTHCLRGHSRIAATPQLPALRSDRAQQDPCCLSEAGCCQVGFHCDRQLRACVRDFAAPVPWVTRELTPGDDRVALSGVIRCDGRFYCPAGFSCCTSPEGKWGCCQYPLGQCCLDGKHCCEYKWKCNKNSTDCVRGDTSIPSSAMREILLL
ncbi:progranulin-like isoform X1 [Sardina pilchardus]|uniref:progranulin-like isoform X1 n=1 Tax=Sardina pilchardus TaxID=27697 RepID=UPI002E0E81DD